MRITMNTHLRRITVILATFLLPVIVYAADDEVSPPVSTKKVRDDRGYKNNDGEPYNKTHGISLRLGPGGRGDGGTNPLGLPPSALDVEVGYVHPTGLEGNVGIFPGITAGARYRAGAFLYGSAGGGLIISKYALGPGVYAALGMTIMRHWPVALEFEAKQAIGLGIDRDGVRLILPYALRLGAGYYF